MLTLKLQTFVYTPDARRNSRRSPCKSIINQQTLITTLILRHILLNLPNIKFLEHLLSGSGLVAREYTESYCEAHRPIFLFNISLQTCQK
jgi:hypothetical protein